jgi:hypothetical protein
MKKNNIKLFFCILFLILVIVFILFYKHEKYEKYENYNKLKIVINSYKSNSQAMNKLIDSLKKCEEFNNYEILVFIGGYYDNKEYIVETTDNNIKYIFCNHNSIDFTGLIGIMEYLPIKEDEYYFYLHDTTVVGSNFLKNLNNINLNNNDVTTLSLRPTMSMNIGIYSNKIIHDLKDILLEQKNTDENKSQEYKKQGVKNEDIIFHNDKNNKLINNKDNFVNVSEPYDFYNTGTMRVVEYYDIDLYKIKANWYIKNDYELSV